MVLGLDRRILNVKKLVCEQVGLAEAPVANLERFCKQWQR